MSKDGTFNEEDAPPSYTEVISSPSTATSSRTPNPNYYTSHLATHLSTLPSRIRDSQYAHSTQQAAQDLELITLLVPHVEGFLSDLAGMARNPPVAELTFVPEAAVPKAWIMSGAQERRREGEVVQLVRVEPEHRDGKGGKGGDERKSIEPSSGLRDWKAVQFDEWGRWDEDSNDSNNSGPATWWWWRDEAMARRLATYLQPRTEPKVERKHVQAVVQQVKEERRGWGWGRKKSTTNERSSASPAPLSPATDVPKTASEEDRVTMTVRPDEITFRRENEFGIWEGMTGWGVVVTVKIRRT